MAAVAGDARAQLISGSAEPSYSHVDSDSRDQSGARTHWHTDELTQRYRLSVDRPLTEYLAASVGGTLIDDRAWTETNGIWSDVHARSSTLYGRLTLGTPVLNVSVGADRREDQLLAQNARSYITDSYTANASWRPLDLPQLQLQLAHVDTWDRARLDRDVTTDSAQLSTRYAGHGFEGRYALSWTRAEDRLHESDVTAVEQTAFVSETDRFFGGRTSTYVSGTVQTRNATTGSTGVGGTVAQQRVPTAGLSAVLALPNIVTNVTLSPNPQLIDGNTSASAGVNLGYNLAIAGDLNARDVGAQFADAVTDVNTIYVWVDRQLSPAVGSALAGRIQVYTSDDNQRWTPISGVGVPVVSPIQNRIEITIVQSRARYMKVTLQPLPLGATTDANFRDLFVTEIQFLLVLPVTAVPRNLTSVLASATAIARTMFLKQPDLSHDLSATVTRQTGPDRTTYLLSNGLSAAHKISDGLSVSARGARQDVNDGVTHTGTWLWTTGLAGNPLPTANWSLTYSGSKTDAGLLQHSGTAFGRADWYEGISSQASATASIGTQGLRVTKSVQATGSTSLIPNPYVTVTVGALYTRSALSDPVLGESWSQFARIDGTMSITPAPALSAVATVSRVIIGVNPTTFATASLNYSPFRGDFQFTVAYSRTLDTEAQSTTEYFSPSLRWNVRRNVFLTTSYAIVNTSQPALATSSRALMTTLLITL